MVLVQFTAQPPFAFDVALLPDSGVARPAADAGADAAEPGALPLPLQQGSSMLGSGLGRELAQRSLGFQQRFERVFGLQDKHGYDGQARATAEAALSGLVGSTGYFHGPMLESVPGGQPKLTPPAELFSGVPARNK